MLGYHGGALSFAPGSRLGPYEIVAPLGAGGMGEVYRALDSRLGRDVALKVLPAALAGDADRLRRFEQEARAASALNHPNILVLHDLGTADDDRHLRRDRFQVRDEARRLVDVPDVHAETDHPRPLGEKLLGHVGCARAQHELDDARFRAELAHVRGEIAQTERSVHVSCVDRTENDGRHGVILPPPAYVSGAS